MNEYNILSDDAVLFLYLLKFSFERNTSTILITHGALKKHLERDRIAESIANNFCKKLKPYVESIKSENPHNTGIEVRIKFKGLPGRNSLPEKVNEIPSKEVMLGNIFAEKLRISFERISKF